MPTEVPERLTLAPAKGYKRVHGPGRYGIASMVLPDFDTVHPNAVQGVTNCDIGRWQTIALRPSCGELIIEFPVVYSLLEYDLSRGVSVDFLRTVSPSDWNGILPNWWRHYEGEIGEVLVMPHMPDGYPAGGPYFHPWTLRGNIDGHPECIRKFMDHVHLFTAHGVQPVPGQSGQLSYFFSLQHCLVKRRTTIRLRAYLQRYWSEVFTAAEIDELAVFWEGQTQPRELHIITDQDEIEGAYTWRPFGSCMGHDRDSYNCYPYHPTAVYGGKRSDLAVAVIYEPGAEKGDWRRIAARCIVWPDKMRACMSIYGDYQRMEASLQAAGYEITKDFVGAKLNKIKSDRGPLVMPYLDIADGVIDYGTHLEVVSHGGDYECHRTDGLAEDTYGVCCDRCEDRFDPEWGGGPVGDEHWCDHCLSEYSFHCEYDEERYPDSEMSSYKGPYGETYSEDGLRRGIDAGDLFICAHDSTVYTTCSNDYVIAEDDGETYHSDASCLIHDEVWDKYITYYAPTVELSDGSQTWTDDGRYGSEEYFDRLKELGVTDPEFPLHHAMPGELEAAA